MGIFNKAKTKQKKKSKEQVIPSFETDKEMEEFNEKLDKFTTLKTKITELTAEYKSVESDIKEIGKLELIKMLEDGQKKKSFHLASTIGGTVMVVPQDRYLSIDDERANYLNETYGTYDEDESLIETFVEESSEFKFNMKVLERNQEAIEKFFEECEDITDEDKENLIECVTKYSIKKGTIDQLCNISNNKEVDVETLYEEIHPVIQLKGVK